MGSIRLVNALTARLAIGDDKELVACLRADLSAAQYTVDAVTERLGTVAAGALFRDDATPARHVLAGAHDALAILIRFFTLGDERPAGDLERVCPETGVAGLQRLGLMVRTEADLFQATVDLRPYATAGTAVSHWIMSDPGEVALGRPLPADYVLGVGGASSTLAQVTMRRPVSRALDLGTGCGIQALHLADHVEHIVATDISQRALDIAAFNAALAGIDLDLRLGDMLAPVAGETFDLVVSNPPFVITPRAQGMPHYEYRDGGRAGDDLTRDLFLEVGTVLAPGGVAQFLGNWEHHEGQAWQDRVAEWVDASGLDAWIVQREVQDPAEYAALWLRDGGLTEDRDQVKWRSLYAHWLDDFAARKVTGVGLGMVLLRKPELGTAPLRRIEEVTGKVAQPLGQHFADVLAAHDVVGNADDETLTGFTLVVAGDVTIERHFRPGEAEPAAILIRQGGGFGRAISVSSEVAGFVGACDGDLTVGQILGGIAVLLDVDPQRLADAVLPVIRDLVLDGILTLEGRSVSAQ